MGQNGLRKRLIKVFLFIGVCAISTTTHAFYKCCSQDTVALCGEDCCKTECDSQGKCPSECPDDGTFGTDKETCCKDGHSYVEGSGYTGTSDACKQCTISSDCEGKLDVAEDECVDCIQGECKAVKQNDDKWCCNSKTGYTWTGTGCCLFSKSILLSDGTKACCKEDEEVVNEECCPSDRVAEVNGVKSCCLTSEHVSYDGIGNARCCPQGKEAASDGTCCADEERALKKDGSFACCASDDYSSETCCSHNGKTWVNNKCEDCPENAKYEENAECFCGQNPRDLRCCESTNVAKHGTTQECCTSDETKTTLLSGTDTYCCPTASAGFVIDSGKCCPQTSSYFYSEENEDCFCATNPEDSRCLKCPETCPSNINETANNWCLLLSGKDLNEVTSCIKDKVKDVTVSDDLSSFTFPVKTGGWFSSETKKYTVNISFSSLFCGVVNSDSISVVQKEGNKVCYNDIDKVSAAFSDYLIKIKDECFTDEFFYQAMDTFVESNSNIPTTLKLGWKCCKGNYLRNKFIASSLASALEEGLKDCYNGLYCNTSDCMKFCCSSYKEDSSGNPIVTQECCESIKGEYSELSGNQVQCCTGCKAPSSAFLDLGDYVKELFGIKTAYAEESGMCIISCKEGYVKAGDSVACCPANGEKEVTLGSDGETCCSDDKAYKDGSYSDGTNAVCGCPSERQLLDGTCCKVGKYVVVNEKYENGSWNDETMCCPSSDYIGINGTCCLSSKRAALSATERVCCNDNQYPIAYSYFVRVGLYRNYSICCSNQSDVVVDANTKKTDKITSGMCCSSSLLKKSDTDSNVSICCNASTDEVIDGECCSESKVAYQETWFGLSSTKVCCAGTVKVENGKKVCKLCSDTEEPVNNECCIKTSVAQHNDTKECCKGSTPNKTTVLNGTDSYCCPNDKKDFVTDQGKCCSNSATYDSDKDCFCAKNPTDSKCSGGCSEADISGRVNGMCCASGEFGKDGNCFNNG